MKVARVIGDVVCTIQHPTYEGHRLMLCAILDFEGVPTGQQEIAVDRVQAGIGDRVLIMSEGNGVRQLLGANAGPIRDLIVGVIDQVSIDHSSLTGSSLDKRDADEPSDGLSDELSDETASESSSEPSDETSSEHFETGGEHILTHDGVEYAVRSKIGDVS